MDQPLALWDFAPPERADAARNRKQLLATAREMIEELGPERVTMDALAERSGLGKGTVYRRFGTRAGIFGALLDDGERTLQEQVLTGPPPLGPGAPPLERLVAYGESRIQFMLENLDIARSAVDGRQQIPAGAQTPMTRLHIRTLLSELELGAVNLDLLAIQLTAALDGPILLYVSATTLNESLTGTAEQLTRAWQNLVERVCRP